MIYPQFIKEFDKIYLVAPSFGCTTSPYTERLDSAISFFEKRNYKIKEGINTRKYTLGASNTKELRAQEINDAFSSDASLVASVGGGELMCDIVDYLDFKLIKENPKWFMGCSDNTWLTYLLTTICDMASLYAINFPTFGVNNPYQNILDTYSLLTGKTSVIKNYSEYELPGVVKEDPLDGYLLTEKTEIHYKNCKKIKTKGRLLGGCLDILSQIVGTPMDKTKEFVEKYKNDGIIWYIEACDLNAMQIYRALLQMKRAGWFLYTKAILFGRPYTAYNRAIYDIDQYNAATLTLGNDIPMAFDLDFGHVPPNIPIINGALCDIVVKNNSVKMKYEYK